MPSYDYKCEECNNVTSKILSVAKRKEPEEVPCEECGGSVFYAFLEAPKLVSGVGSIIGKTNDDWKDKLKEMKKQNPRSTINV